MNPLQFDMIISLTNSACPKWNTSKKIQWFESKGAKFSNKVYQNGHPNNESKLEFFVGKWSKVQYILVFSIIVIKFGATGKYFDVLN